MRIGFINSLGRGKLSFDDQILADYLTIEGHEISCVFWDDPDETFQECDIYLNRSCFDYYQKIEAWHNWLNRMEAENIPLLNPAPAMRSNSCKSYLKEIIDRGGSIIPTLFIQSAEMTTIQNRLLQAGWDTIILKPFVGAAAANLIKINASTVTEETLRPFITEDQTYDLLIQPYWPEFASAGERSFIFFGKEFSHAILKMPAAGDFRVQGRFGGTCEIYQAKDEEIAQARDALMASPYSEDLLYARVDGVFKEGKFYLSELEITEPWLFFNEYPKGCEIFAKRLGFMVKLPTAAVEEYRT